MWGHFRCLLASITLGGGGPFTSPSLNSVLLANLSLFLVSFYSNWAVPQIFLQRVFLRKPSVCLCPHILGSYSVKAARHCILYCSICCSVCKDNHFCTQSITTFQFLPEQDCCNTILLKSHGSCEIIFTSPESVKSRCRPAKYTAKLAVTKSKTVTYSTPSVNLYLRYIHRQT